MNTTTMMTGAGALITSGFSLYDKKKKGLNKESANNLVATTLATSVTAATGAAINFFTVEQIHHKYSSAYVESMSDEELERALVKMDLLAAETETDNVTKRI